jgi:hypothetical protein
MVLYVRKKASAVTGPANKAAVTNPFLTRRKIKAIKKAKNPRDEKDKKYIRTITMLFFLDRKIEELEVMLCSEANMAGAKLAAT